ncbi:MAG: hypothetical protein ACRDP9_29640 [Kribbellaceae bacterium]
MSKSDELQNPQAAEAATDPTGVAVERHAERPEGAAVAAVLATGVGAAVLGLATTLSEASTSFADWLAWSDRVGPLSGKTIVAVAAWLLSWVVLHVVLRDRGRLTGGVLVLTGILIGLGVLGTFPTFFELFAGD